MDLIMSDTMTLTSLMIDISANSQRQLYRIFARHLGQRLGLNELQLHTQIASLKGNDSASIGGGVMILHGWVNMVDKPVMSFARLKTPITTPAAVDQQPLDLVILLLSPKSDGPVHLSRLARVSRFMRDTHICEMLRGATSESAIEAIFAEQPQMLLQRSAA